MVLLEIEAEHFIRKEVKNGSTSGRIFVPKKWKGREAIVVFEKKDSTSKWDEMKRKAKRE